MKTVLWVDDEIDYLKSHIRYLEKHGFRVLTAQSGYKAFEILETSSIDIILMDQMMIGLDGLEVVDKIRQNYQELPIVMVTQSEEEELMDRALGGRVNDYLTKPVNPSQVLLVLKRFLQSGKLKSRRVAEEIAEQAERIREMQGRNMTWDDWVSLYRSYVEKSVALDSFMEKQAEVSYSNGMINLLNGFSKTVQNNYPEWIKAPDGPLMPHRYFERVILKECEKSREVVFIIMDCMRYDQWLTISPYLETLFHQEIEFMCVILPSATPYSRNALFAGALPRDIWRYYRNEWLEDHGTPGLNRYEYKHMIDTLHRLGSPMAERATYFKVSTHSEGEHLRRSLSHFIQGGFLAVVVNYLDHLTHGRSELDLLKELAPDRISFRELVGTWFKGSFLFEVLKTIAARGATAIITSDHGSVFSRKSTWVKGGRGMSSSMRYRVGHSLSADDRYAIVVNDPAAFGLPNDYSRKTYVFARDDYLLVHPQMPRSEFHKFINTFQHGGVSTQEMIVPSIILRPKKS